MVWDTKKVVLVGAICVALTQIGIGLRALSYLVGVPETAYAAKETAQKVDEQFNLYLPEAGRGGGFRGGECNVRANTSGTVTMWDYTGAFGGESNDCDNPPANVVWMSGSKTTKAPSGAVGSPLIF